MNLNTFFSYTSSSKVPDFLGRNASVLVLSFNRSNHTIQLLQTFFQKHPAFQGELIVLDQGSSDQEFQQLSQFQNDFGSRFTLVREFENLGVAAGRNRLAAMSKKDWIVFLDNDLEIVEPLFGELHKTYVSTCSTVLNFTLRDHSGLLVAHGATFQLSQVGTQFQLSANPKNAELESQSFALPNQFKVVYGGAFAILRETWHLVGGFDEGYFVGFEDYDFAIRAQLSGLKIDTCKASVLESKKETSLSPSDLDYAKTRFSSQNIKNSASYFEKKWGANIWSEGTEDWLRRSRKNFKITESHIEESANLLSQKPYLGPKILLVTDVEGWAFDRIANKWRSAPLKDFDVDIVHWANVDAFLNAYNVDEKDYFEIFMNSMQDFDVIHFFWVGSLLSTRLEAIEKWKDKLSFSIYDHYTIGHQALPDLLKLLKDRFFVSSEKLALELKSKFSAKCVVLSDGVDTDMFKYRERAISDKSRNFVIGWAGNSAFGGVKELDKKGFAKLFVPTIELLKKNGLDVTVQIADKAITPLTFEQMPAFYDSLDLFLCTSPYEGTPNPILEAISCGVPVISTDVGIVRESLGHVGQGYVLPADASVDELANSIKKLLSSPSEYNQISIENYNQRSFLDWSTRFEKVSNFFHSLVSVAEHKTRFCLLPFTTPSIEPDGSIRLCSSSSIFPYREETNMGQLTDDNSLYEVWTDTKYRDVRLGLLGLRSLKPFCSNCDYRRSSPAWLLQYHLALQQFWRNEKTDRINMIISRYANRHEEYETELLQHNTPSYPRASVSISNNPNSDAIEMLSEFIDGANLALNVDFNTLNRCNVGCVMCPPSIKIEDLGFQRDKLFVLTEDNFVKMTSGIRLNSSHFVGAYAEPLMNKELPNLISAAKKVGSFTAITTNAMLLNSERAQSLIHAGLDMISVSIHGGTKEVAEKVMRRSNFDTVRNNLLEFRNLRRQSNRNLLTYFNFVGMTLNIHDFNNLLEFCREVEFENINLFSLIAGDEVVDKRLSLETNPDLLKRHVLPVLDKAHAYGINVVVSSPYREILFG